MTLVKGYSDGPQGQIHWRASSRARTTDKRDLFCFSPAPFSSISYANLLPELGSSRRVIAPDYPGQGGSDGGSATPSIAEHAASMLAVIETLSDDTAVDVLGFHSGCLVAAELKLIAPDRINKAVLIDVPAFDPDTRLKYLPMAGAPFEPSTELASVSKAWDMAVTKRSAVQPLEQCYAMFADSVANGPRMNATFHAAFTYDVERRLAALEPETIIIATHSLLLEPSRRAASMIPDNQYIERLDIEGSVLDANAHRIAETIELVLD